MGRFKPITALPGGTDGERLRGLLPLPGIGSQAEALRLARSIIRSRDAEWRGLRRSLRASYMAHHARLAESIDDMEEQLIGERRLVVAAEYEGGNQR